MADTGDMGFGVTVTFSSGFVALVRGVRRRGMAREPIDTSHAATTNGWMTFIPSDLKDPGEVEIDMIFKPDQTPPITGAAETVTITYPVPSGLTNGATWANSGFLTGFENECPYDALMTATAVIKFSAAPTITAAS